MTKKQINTFMKVIQMNNREKFPDLCGLIKLENDNFYYASNPYMVLRSTEMPSDVFVPEESRNIGFYTCLQKHFRDAILRNDKEVELPRKKDLVAYRKTLNAYDKRNKKYPLYTSTGDVIYFDIGFLNLFLDVFDGGRAFMHGPLEPLYLISKDKVIEGILLPVRVIKDKEEIA